MDDIFIKIYDKYYLDVYRLSYSYLLNKQDAEDITQNTFIKLYHHKEIFIKNLNTMAIVSKDSGHAYRCRFDYDNIKYDILFSFRLISDFFETLNY